MTDELQSEQAVGKKTAVFITCANQAAEKWHPIQPFHEETS